jgi:hypothetical protein
MPLGRPVLGRITTVEEKEGQDKRFNMTLRRSVVIHGCNTVSRSSLSVGQQVEAIVLAMAEGKYFCQLKGSFLKLKVKIPEEESAVKKLSIGDHIACKLTKVTKEKIVGTLEGKITVTESEQLEVTRIEKLLSSVEEEGQKDVAF